MRYQILVLGLLVLGYRWLVVIDIRF